MEKYVEIRIAAHKLCDSCYNFVDQGIKRRINAENESRQSGISGMQNGKNSDMRLYYLLH